MTNPSGFLIVNKPIGVTSHDVVAFARRRLNTQKIGHAGTLDPLATGVLVLGIGQGTRLLEYFVGCDKEYEAEVTFGGTSNTFDIEGIVKPNLKAKEFPQTKLIEVLKKFTGEILQMPPIFSALKVGGIAAYKLARAGEEVDLKPRQVKIFEIKLNRFKYPKAEFRVHCGSGTYIRSLAHDLGETLGVGGYLSKLTRTRSGKFDLAMAVQFRQIRPEKILSLEEVVADLPHRNLNKLEVEKIRHGQKIPARNSSETGVRAGFYEDRLIAMLICEPEKGTLQPVKVLNQALDPTRF